MTSVFQVITEIIVLTFKTVFDTIKYLTVLCEEIIDPLVDGAVWVFFAVKDWDMLLYHGPDWATFKTEKALKLKSTIE